ncbi:carbohydrate kinase family protein [Pseudonocardia alaniniphila]|uniref:carbohydrate kinase family protein n=1 Tax=Pseudonocardia alaniniphila TaxID=75291 RepID=UPI0031E40B3D
MLDGLEAEGVGVRHVERRRGETTAQSVVLVSRDTASRALLTRPGPTLRELPAGYDWVHCDQAGYPAAQAGRARAGRLSLDDGNAVAGFVPAGVDLYVPTAEVLLRRFGAAGDGGVLALLDAARAATVEGVGAVVVTRGGEGAVALDPAGDELVVPAVDVPVESTLGAGDVFHGAMLAALALGHGFAGSVRLAVVCAGLSCRGLDGRSAIPGLAETLRLTTTTTTTSAGRPATVPATQKGRP